MKIWQQHGSEHSANLVMIGHFEDETEAVKAKEIIDALTEQVTKDQESGVLVFGSPSDRYGDEVLDLLMRLNIASIGPHELEQFAYGVNIKVEDQNLVITTDELDIAAFIKVLFHRGARIELYSAHSYPESDDGKGK